MANALKDIGYYRTMTEDLAAEGGVAEAVLALYRQASDAGHADKPVPELVGLLEQSRV